MNEQTFEIWSVYIIFNDKLQTKKGLYPFRIDKGVNPLLSWYNVRIINRLKTGHLAKSDVKEIIYVKKIG